MKELLKDIISPAKTPAEGALLLREYLQVRILGALQASGVFGSWAFLGGTALRFLYRLPRFSEDLDFSVIGDTDLRVTAAAGFNRYISRVRKTFEAEAYDVETREKTETVVQSAFVSFPGLLYDLGLSQQSGQKISIKIEVDTNPPAYAGTETSLVRRHVLLNIQHYDKPSLLAGKLHALIHRPHVKGRDVYDLVWYLSDRTWPEPNLPLLRASLEQTGMGITEKQAADWRTLVAERLAGMEWDRVVEDVRPFLERKEEIELLTRENVLGLLERE